MKYCKLREDIVASSIVMGCMRIADKPLTQTEAVIIEALKSGVNMFDLADVYADGDAERVFGVAIRDLELPRKEYLVQTKCGIRKENGRINRFDFSKEHIIASVDGILKRLQTEYLDVLLLHRPDALVEPSEEDPEALAGEVECDPNYEWNSEEDAIIDDNTLEGDVVIDPEYLDEE